MNPCPKCNSNDSESGVFARVCRSCGFFCRKAEWDLLFTSPIWRTDKAPIDFLVLVNIYGLNFMYGCDVSEGTPWLPLKTVLDVLGTKLETMSDEDRKLNDRLEDGH